MVTCIAGEEHKMLRKNRHGLLLALATVLIISRASVGAVAGAGTCPEQMQTDEAASKSLADGNAAFEAGDMAKAEAQWKQIRQCAPGTADWPKAVFNLGLLEHRRKNFRQAVEYFHEVLQSHPNDKEPGANLMETNRNYSYRSALAISECYEAMGAYRSALHYAWLAKTKYRYYSWCGTCYASADAAVNKRIAYLTMRASRVHIWASVLVVGLLALWKVKKRSTT